MVRARPGSVAFAATDAGGAAGCGRGSRCAGGNGDRGCLRAELKVTAGEFIQRPLVLEKNHLAVRLTAEVKTHCQLRHCGVADVSPLLINPAFAHGTANPRAPFPDGGKDRIAIASLKKTGAFSSVLEYLDGVVELVGSKTHEGKGQKQHERKKTILKLHDYSHSELDGGAHIPYPFHCRKPELRQLPWALQSKTGLQLTSARRRCLYP